MHPVIERAEKFRKDLGFQGAYLEQDLPPANEVKCGFVNPALSRAHEAVRHLKNCEDGVRHATRNLKEAVDALEIVLDILEK